MKKLIILLISLIIILTGCYYEVEEFETNEDVYEDKYEQEIEGFEYELEIEEPEIFEEID